MKIQHLDSHAFMELKLGIVGCGHLGQALLKSFLLQGFPEEHVYISHRGNLNTSEKIRQLGFTGPISDNEMILRQADIVFLTVRPQDAGIFQRMTLSPGTLVISCLAGLSTTVLENIFHAPVLRMMVSGPDTLLARKGMAALYPYHELAGSLLEAIGFSLFPVLQESDFDFFTTGVCLPAALLVERNEAAIKEAIASITEEYAAFARIYDWAKDVLPVFHTEGEKKDYIARMITKGGITEAIVDSVQSGESFLAALRKGMQRCQDISREMSASILKGRDE